MHTRSTTVYLFMLIVLFSACDKRMERSSEGESQTHEEPKSPASNVPKDVSAAILTRASRHFLFRDGDAFMVSKDKQITQFRHYQIGFDSIPIGEAGRLNGDTGNYHFYASAQSARRYENGHWSRWFMPGENRDNMFYGDITRTSRGCVFGNTSNELRELPDPMAMEPAPTLEQVNALKP